MTQQLLSLIDATEARREDRHLEAMCALSQVGKALFPQPNHEQMADLAPDLCQEWALQFVGPQFAYTVGLTEIINLTTESSHLFRSCLGQRAKHGNTYTPGDGAYMYLVVGTSTIHGTLTLVKASTSASERLCYPDKVVRALMFIPSAGQRRPVLMANLSNASEITRNCRLRTRLAVAVHDELGALLMDWNRVVGSTPIGVQP